MLFSFQHSNLFIFLLSKQIMTDMQFGSGAVVDSAATLAVRCDECGMPDNVKQALKDASINTISQLAYAFGQPGQPIDSVEFKKWAEDLIPGISIGGLASLKRLLFESQTQMLALLKESVLNPEPSTARKVPQPEREARLTALRNRLSGVLIEGHSEPCHSMLDFFVQVYETNTVRFLPLEKCYSRLVELTNSAKPQAKMLELEATKLVVREKDEAEYAVQSSYQMLEALKRRGLSLEFAGVMSFRAHEMYISALFSHMNRDPPPGFARTSVAQLIAADKAAWTRVIEIGVKPRQEKDGAYPLDDALMRALESYQVSFVLLPLPAKQQGKGHPAATADHKRPTAARSKGNRKGSFRMAPYGQKGGQGKSTQRVPAEIRAAGGTATSPDGQPVCFDYSLGKCSEKVADGSRCRKGFHICAICYKPRPIPTQQRYSLTSVSEATSRRHRQWSNCSPRF